MISLFSDRSGKRRLWVRFSLYSFAAALVASVVLREHVVAAYIALVICGFFLNRPPVRSGRCRGGLPQRKWPAARAG
ncbi:Uncharacterised protein [Raoultella terrigena]|uniref:Uncharacterized protein n=1 Tax=Raoultella terrigena TaxID=577 RepID=A0A4U9D5U0_RAOTE|nr:Uncharacterised protein [Raoultella terrigena]